MARLTSPTTALNLSTGQSRVCVGGLRGGVRVGGLARGERRFEQKLAWLDDAVCRACKKEVVKSELFCLKRAMVDTRGSFYFTESDKVGNF